jgi:hypothetical protein
VKIHLLQLQPEAQQILVGLFQAGNLQKGPQVESLLMLRQNYWQRRLVDIVKGFRRHYNPAVNYVAYILRF